MLNSSQLHQITIAPTEASFASSNHAPVPQPTTLKKLQNIEDWDPQRTPKHPRDIHKSVNHLGRLSRDQRTVLYKVQKALGQVTAEQAILQATNRRLQFQIKELESKKKKKKVTLDPNTIFANVESIKHSLEEAEQARIVAEAGKVKIAERKPQKKAKEPLAEEEALRTSKALQKTRMEACMFQWEL